MDIVTLTYRLSSFQVLMYQKLGKPVYGRMDLGSNNFPQHLYGFGFAIHATRRTTKWV